MKIAIDIGHAHGTGARGNGYEEHDVVGNIAAALADKLAARGHECHVIDFPEKDNRADLVATVKAVNALTPDFSISLHADSASMVVGKGKFTYPDGSTVLEDKYGPNPSPHGGHVCYFPGSQKGITLARSIARHLVTVLPGRAESTVARRDLYVLKNTCCPAVLVECGFITNPEDAHLMTQTPATIAEAIACGVDLYVNGKN